MDVVLARPVARSKRRLVAPRAIKAQSAIAEAIYAAKGLSRFPLFTGDKVQIGITYYNLSPVKKVE